MGVEGGHLVHFGEGQAHFGGKGRQVVRGQGAVAVLDQMQVLDQQVPGPGPVA